MTMNREGVDDFEIVIINGIYFSIVYQNQKNLKNGVLFTY